MFGCRNRVVERAAVATWRTLSPAVKNFRHFQQLKLEKSRLVCRYTAVCGELRDSVEQIRNMSEKNQSQRQTIEIHICAFERS